jgi:AcrR family transcriptional regulator
MTTKKVKVAADSGVISMPRKLRADAAENRERILEVAKEAFLSSGPDVSMDEIAKLAVVGPGTLYRHFPTRDALVEAVYLTGVQQLSAAQKTFSESMSPIEALRSWMLLFVDYMAAKQIILPALNLLACGTE